MTTAQYPDLAWYARHAEHWTAMAGELAQLKVWLVLHGLSDSPGPGAVLQAVAADYARWAVEKAEDQAAAGVVVDP